MLVYRDVSTGRFVSREAGELAESIGDPSIISQKFGTQSKIDDIDFSETFNEDFSYLDIYDIDFETER